MATLRAMAPAGWDREAVPGWTVRDVAARILGDFYGRLARDRDGHRHGPAFAAGETLESFIHRINQERVDAFARHLGGNGSRRPLVAGRDQHGTARRDPRPGCGDRLAAVLPR